MFLVRVQASFTLWFSLRGSIGSLYLFNFSGYPVGAEPKSVPLPASQLTSCGGNVGHRERRKRAEGDRRGRGDSEGGTGLLSLLF